MHATHLNLPGNVLRLSSFLLLICLCACSALAQSPQAFTIQGQLAQPRNGQVYLLDKAENQVSSAPITGSTFTLKGTQMEPGLYNLKIDGVPDPYSVFVEPSSMQVSIKDDGSYKIAGSKLHSQWEQYQTEILNPARNQLIKLYQERAVAQQKGDTVLFNQLMKQNDSVSISVGRRMREAVAQKPFTFFNLSLLSSGGWEDDYVKTMLDEFRGQFASYPTFQKMENGLKEKALQLQKVAVGNQAYNFTLPDSSGAFKSLEEVRKAKKLVLLDFWASWCGPCIVEMPSIKKLYSTYASQGLEIISISVDENHKQWLQGIKKHTPPGLQVVVDKENKAVQEWYVMQGIPQTYLIDQQGVIRAHSLRGEELANKVAELLNN
ncbi:TlpA disulfide reductase family protein [Telluribacter sp. SYSU D00476]|uniref:TlpA disulfide reductase family protein n=1 Tax=Telluribacter sp. SYSU D00476 TaxID=2811430 RepID=UPI001FF519E6|nr:TlpA disulfide reductase family protein [Telluribacter sp. SYSU D00476]